MAEAQSREQRSVADDIRTQSSRAAVGSLDLDDVSGGVHSSAAEAGRQDPKPKTNRTPKLNSVDRTEVVDKDTADGLNVNLKHINAVEASKHPAEGLQQRNVTWKSGRSREIAQNIQVQSGLSHIDLSTQNHAAQQHLSSPTAYTRDPSYPLQNRYESLHATPRIPSSIPGTIPIGPVYIHEFLHGTQSSSQSHSLESITRTGHPAAHIEPQFNQKPPRFEINPLQTQHSVNNHPLDHFVYQNSHPNLKSSRDIISHSSHHPHISYLLASSVHIPAPSYNPLPSSHIIQSQSNCLKPPLIPHYVTPRHDSSGHVLSGQTALLHINKPKSSTVSSNSANPLPVNSHTRQRDLSRTSRRRRSLPARISTTNDKTASTSAGRLRATGSLSPQRRKFDTKVAITVRYNEYPEELELCHTTDPKRRKLLQNRMALRRLRVRRAAEMDAMKVRLEALRSENQDLKVERAKQMEAVMYFETELQVVLERMDELGRNHHH